MPNHFSEIQEKGKQLIEYYCDSCDLYFWLCQDEIQNFRSKKCPECGEEAQPNDDSISVESLNEEEE